LIEISTRQRPDSSPFPPTEICRAIGSDVENIVQLETAAIGTATATALISTPLVWSVATVGGFALAGLLACDALSLDTLSTLAALLLAFSGLLPLTALLATRLGRLLRRSWLLPAGLLTARLLPLLRSRLLAGWVARLLALFPRTLPRLIVARDLLRTIAPLTGTLLASALSGRPTLLVRLRLPFTLTALIGLTGFPTWFAGGRLTVFTLLVARLALVTFLVGTSTLSRRFALL
jgi:hypothetical protein